MDRPPITTSTVFKSLSPSGKACFGGTLQWSLPHNGQPGEWMEVEGDRLQVCKNGLHLAVGPQIVSFLGQTLYLAEYDDEDYIDGGVKIVARRARVTHRVEGWTSSAARAFSIEMARLVLPIYEAAVPNDSRPRHAIKMAEGGHGTATRAAGWESCHIVHRDPDVQAAARAAGECVYAGEAKYGKAAARRVAKCALRAYRAYGLKHADAQAVLFGLLCRYLSGVLVPPVAKRHKGAIGDEQCPDCGQWFNNLKSHQRCPGAGQTVGGFE